jgi:hypothetical protein
VSDRTPTPTPQQRARYYAEGGRSGVLVWRDGRWAVLARFQGPLAENMAKAMAEAIQLAHDRPEIP